MRTHAGHDHDTHEPSPAAAHQHEVEHHPPDHTAQGGHASGHDAHGGHAGHAEVFRRRFWVSLVLAVPVVLYSRMLMELFDWEPPGFWGSDQVPLVLGSVIFWWGGWPFLSGGVDEVRRRQPGMMLLVGMAISVAYGASLATEAG
ncbi:MAG: heavy metal translocating P-type ATPase, partial [Acidimicrobiia bacterium]|nr:heavy metal translocating P-type ATPase [Acidimicrobiia bacterium]